MPIAVHDNSKRMPVAAAQPALDRSADLEIVLAAWHDATVRLQETHETLRLEVGRLSDELERKNHELARKNRLADLGRMASHVAHEVRNTLVPVSLYSTLLRRRLASDAGSLDVLAKIEAGFRALDATVNDLLSFTANRPPQWRTFLVRELVDEVCESLGPQIAAQSVTVDIDVPPNMLLSADREMLRRAVLNLTLNALDAMPRGGDLVITGLTTPAGFELEIADSGNGIPDADKGRVFEPFYTTKSGGTGLGLSVVYQIVEAHGGNVTATNCPEGGAAFTIIIPQRAMEAAA